MPDYRLFAGAVALGAAMIAAGLYQGCTEGRGGSIVVSPPAVQPSPPAPAPKVPPVDPEEMSRVRAMTEATRAIEDRKPELVKKCWAPALKKAPEPASAPYFLALSIDAKGKLTSSMVVMPRVGSRVDVWACLRTVTLDLSITPPGKALDLNIPLNFP